ncbi:dolichol kinase EVAN isoform X2 [Henckelia pumila]|uniref:dolichol kinase EVAN isoform X2 n=1 Tax=Henckelia pumila TaxID=405737 RepID=UPI003C6E7073
MAPPLLQLNGERAVVLLYVIRILSSSSLSLIPQAFSLSVLSLFALCVEIFADHASNPLAHYFQTRPGASSGILLGAVTLPSLMFSRLIQILRAVTLHEVGIEELEHLKLQFWAVSAICFTVLFFLCIIGRHQTKNIDFFSSKINLNAKHSFMVVASLGFCFSSLFGGWHVSLMLLCVLCHGLTAVKLLQKMLRTFPACVSIGESLLVTSGLVIYFGDMLTCTAAKVFLVQNGIKRSEISTIIQGMIFGLLLLPVFYKYVIQMWECCASFWSNGAQENHDIQRSFVFYVLLTSVLVVVAPSWMQFVHDFQMHPLLWALHFVFSEPLKRLTLCVYWLVIISVAVRQFYYISKNSKTERILLRKYYHLLAVSIFVPALVFQAKFLDLAFGAALAVFLVLEIIRIWKIWPLGQQVHKFMNAFTDHRDSDLIIISHFSLLLGCAIPIWLSSDFSDRPLAPFAGILSLGIGDTMASMVGHKYGVLRWSKSGKKTIEGTAAGITSVLAACFVLLPLLAATGYIFTMHWFSLIVAVTISGLLEAYTAQLDNAFIPLVFYSLLCL